jgi:hypothetical protein
MVNKALRQAVLLAADPGKRVLGHSGGDGPPILRKGTTDNLRAGTVGGPATFKETTAMKWRKKMTTDVRNETADPGETNGSRQKGQNFTQESNRC